MARAARSGWNSGSRLGVIVRCALIVRCGYACAWCRADLHPPRVVEQGGRRVKIVTTEIDHVIPRACGGTDELSNLVACCSSCNEARRHGRLTARLIPLGIKPSAARAHVNRLLREGIDRRLGRMLADAWYPWHAGRADRNRQRQRERDVRRGHRHAEPWEQAA